MPICVIKVYDNFVLVVRGAPVLQAEGVSY